MAGRPRCGFSSPGSTAETRKGYGDVITAEILLASGYRAHAHHDVATDYLLYQKTFRSGRTQLYSITITLWDLSKQFDHADSETSSGQTAEVLFYLGGDDPLVGPKGFSMELHLEETATVEQIEAFFAKAYAGLGCVPDLHNND